MGVPSSALRRAARVTEGAAYFAAALLFAKIYWLLFASAGGAGLMLASSAAVLGLIFFLRRPRPLWIVATTFVLGGLLFVSLGSTSPAERAASWAAVGVIGALCGASLATAFRKVRPLANAAAKAEGKPRVVQRLCASGVIVVLAALVLAGIDIHAYQSYVMMAVVLAVMAPKLLVRD